MPDFIRQCASTGCLATFVLTFLLFPQTTCRAADLELLQTQLNEGKLAAAAASLDEQIRNQPDDQQALFALGTVQFLQAIEGLGQAHFRYGLLNHRRVRMTMMRLPIPPNPEPEELSYEGARQIVQNYVDGLLTAEQTLAKVNSGDVRLPLRIDQIRMDLDKNGTATVDESLYVIMEYFRNPNRQFSGSLPVINMTFDLADAYWVRGYCHVMSGLGEMILAYNWKDQFERTAHLFYPRVDTPYDYLVAEGSGMFEGFSAENIADFVALIHTINYECSEPDRMKAALAHFETVIQLSRQSFAALNAETDDDHEWVPNPNQKSSPVGIQVRPEMQKGWNDFLNEAELILQGRKLLPFHRGVPGGSSGLFFGRFEDAKVHPELGINVRRMFTDPQRIDLVLWLQGTGMHPFLEKGPRTDWRTWNTIMTQFDGNFLFFAFWFN